LQVSASNDKFQIQLELPGFAPEDFSLKTKDDIIIVEAVHEAKNEDGSTDSRRFSKEFKMPGGVASEKLASTYSGAGILTVSAPRAIQAPEGAQVTYEIIFSPNDYTSAHNNGSLPFHHLGNALASIENH